MTARLTTCDAPSRIHSRSRLTFDFAGGRTRLAVSDLGAPLRVMRGFELGDGRLLVQIISASPGLFSGDSYELAIDVRQGASAVVLTPAATKIHSMPDGGCATQALEATVAAGASLEVYPTLSIPFAASDFRQDVGIELSSDARFGWMDPWSFGRIDSGERYAFRQLSSRLRVNRDGRPLYRDALELAPGEADVAGQGSLEYATHAITGCWFGPCEVWEPEGRLDRDVILGRIGEDGLYARGLFPNGAAFRQGLAYIRSRIASAWHSTEFSQTQFTL